MNRLSEAVSELCKDMTLIGQGEFGMVYKTPEGKAMKVQWYDAGEFESEVNVMKRFSEIGLGVTYDTSYIITLSKEISGEQNKPTQIGVIIMEMVEGTLHDYVEQNRSPQELDHISTLIWKLLVKMKRYQVSHNDLQFTNIGYYHDSQGVLRLKLIDFGLGNASRYHSDFNLLSIGRYLYDDDNENDNIEYLQQHWWPRLKRQLSLQVKDDWYDIHFQYIKLFKQCFVLCHDD